MNNTERFGGGFSFLNEVAQADSIGCCRDFRPCGRANITDRKERDFLATKHGEETRRASVAARCFNSDWLDFFTRQRRCTVVQYHRPKNRVRDYLPIPWREIRSGGA